MSIISDSAELLVNVSKFLTFTSKSTELLTLPTFPIF